MDEATGTADSLAAVGSSSTGSETVGAGIAVTGLGGGGIALPIPVTEGGVEEGVRASPRCLASNNEPATSTRAIGATTATTSAAREGGGWGGPGSERTWGSSLAAAGRSGGHWMGKTPSAISGSARTVTIRPGEGSSPSVPAGPRTPGTGWGTTRLRVAACRSTSSPPAAGDRQADRERGPHCGCDHPAHRRSLLQLDGFGHLRTGSRRHDVRPTRRGLNDVHERRGWGSVDEGEPGGVVLH